MNETVSSKLECVVEYDYDSQLGDELSIRVGDVITDIQTMEGGWWKGTLRGKVGMFPDNFVKLLPNPKKGTSHETEKKCHVLFSYSAAHDDELSLEVGDIVEYMADVEEGWYKGRLNGRVGVFPSNFVEICNTTNNTNCDNKINDSVKSVDEEETKMKYSEINLSNGKLSSRPADKIGESAAPDLTLTNGSSSGAMTTSERLLRNTEPAPGAAPRLPPKPVKDQCIVLFPYSAQNQDELTLVEGEMITILSRNIEDAGWWRGELNGKQGVFPDNFVKVIVSDTQETVNVSINKSKSNNITTNKLEKQLSDKKPQNISADVDKDTSSKAQDKKSSEKAEYSSPVHSTSNSVPDKTIVSPTGSPGSGSVVLAKSNSNSKLTRTSSDRTASASNGQTAEKMLSATSSVRSATEDLVKTPSSSNVSEKKALFSAKNEDRVTKKPAIPTLTKQSNNSVDNLKSTHPTKSDANNDNNVVLRKEKSIIGFEDVNRDQPLTNLTASRVKAPKRRPPSNVFLKESVQDEASHSESDREEESSKKKDMLPANTDTIKDKDPVRSKSDGGNSPGKPFVPGKLGVPVFPVKDTSKGKDDITKALANTNVAKEEKENPIKNIWLEELSRKQANRKSMSALGEKKQEGKLENAGKPAIPSKPLDTRKSLSNLIRRPNSFGDKTGQTQSKPQVSEIRSVLGKTGSHSTLHEVRHHNKSDSVKKISSGERVRKDSSSKDTSLDYGTSKKSLDDRVLPGGKTRDLLRSTSKEGVRESKETLNARETDKKKTELSRKSSDSSKSSDTNPIVHSKNLGRHGTWTFTSPERPSDLQKLEPSRSKLDLASTKSETRLDFPVKSISSSNSNNFKSLDTHEESGFVVVEAANEAMASVWAQDLGGQQPKPPMREKHLSGATSITSSTQDQVKLLEKRVEELEKSLSRVETSFRTEVTQLTGQLESERTKRIELEQELAKLNRIVNTKI